MHLSKIKHPTFVATAIVFSLLYVIAAIRYKGFFSPIQTTSLFSDNAALGLAAIGMTFVILSGGIDLSVGAVIALASIFLGKCIVQWEWPAYLAIPLVLASGAAFGTAMGTIIRLFRLPPFLVTLAGMFLARGLALVLTKDKRLSIRGDDSFDWLVDFSVGFGKFEFNLPAVAFMAAMVVAVVVAHWTRFGRNVYAIGGNAQSAVLMGLPVGKTTIQIYALSGLCAATGGVIYAIGAESGDASVAQLRELDAIAAVFIGGTLLSG
ncbi:MAG: hypothetical protein N2C12_16370, partial [Planctomycetales bacterium]